MATQATRMKRKSLSLNKWCVTASERRFWL